MRAAAMGMELGFDGVIALKAMGASARIVKFSGPGERIGVFVLGGLARSNVICGEALRSG